MKKNKMAGLSSRIFKMWLISYMSILIVPMIISIFLYIISDGVIKEEISKANKASMNQLQQLVDDNLRSIREISINIGWNEQTTGFMHVRRPIDANYQYFMLYIVNNLKVQSAVNRLIDFSYIYFKNSDITISSSGSCSPQELFEFNHEAGQFKYDDWKKGINEIHTWEYQFMPLITSSGQVHNSIAFMQTLPVEHPASAYGTVVIMVDRQKFINFLTNVKWVDGSVIFIIDKNNNIIASTGSFNLPENLRYEQLKKSTQFLNGHIDGKDAIVTHMSSTELDWEFVSIVPQSVFLSKARYVRNLTLAGIVLFILIGGIVAYFFTRKNYTPVQTILETISKKAGISINRYTDEFDFINQSIVLTVDEKEEIAKKLKSQSDILKSNFIMKLLKGNAGDTMPVEEALSNYNISFCSDSFAVILIQIEDMSNFYQGGYDDIVRYEGDKLARSVIAYAVQAAAGKNKIYITEINEVTACLINFNCHKDFVEQELEIISSRLREKIETEFKISYTGALSDVHENIFGIAEAYREALEALEYKFIAGAGKTINYNSIKEAEKENYSYPFTLELQQKFINCIKAGNISTAENIMDGVLDTAISQPSMTMAMAKCLMASIINTMINTVREANAAYDVSFHEQMGHVEKLLQCKTLTDMKIQMKSILKSFEEYFFTLKSDKNTILAQKVKQYIEENYKNIDLNVSYISLAFEMNPAYLSRQFKESTGESLLDYINKVRLEKAKGFLLNKDFNINEIAEAVGYNNSNAFIRAFKKYEGITPGKYREIN